VSSGSFVVTIMIARKMGSLEPMHCARFKKKRVGQQTNNKIGFPISIMFVASRIMNEH